MNGFNRFIMLLIAILMIVIPVFFLLVGFGVIASSVVSNYVNYDAAVQGLSSLSTSSVTQGARIIIAIIGVLIVLIALYLLLKELTFGSSVARDTTIDETPGQETRLTAKAVKSLSENAAREAGAVSPSVSLASDGKPYSVFCDVKAGENSNYTELATQVRENIRNALGSQKVSYEEVQVTVLGRA